MLNIRLAPRAEQDLEEIFDYTVKTWSYNQAVKYQSELYIGFLNIGSQPKIGRHYIFKSGNYRYLHTNRHLIFYKEEKENIIIVRILHESMDLKNKI